MRAIRLRITTPHRKLYRLPPGNLLRQVTQRVRIAFELFITPANPDMRNHIPRFQTCYGSNRTRPDEFHKHIGGLNETVFR